MQSKLGLHPLRSSSILGSARELDRSMTEEATVTTWTVGIERDQPLGCFSHMYATGMKVPT
jgi:hypothetical protein